MATLTRFVVGVSNKGALVVMSKEHHPYARRTVRCRGRECDRFGLEHEFLRLTEPALKLHEGICVDVTNV